jgi:hypothetical protein
MLPFQNQTGPVKGFRYSNGPDFEWLVQAKIYHVNTYRTVWYSAVHCNTKQLVANSCVVVLF